MSKKFQIIVMDPPYEFSDKLRMSKVKRGAAANYHTLNNQDLLSLPIKDIVDPNGAILALWAPSSLLPLGLDLMKAYGFQFKQTYVWVKVKKNPLSYFQKAILKMKKVPEICYDEFAYMRIIRSIADACIPVGKDLINALSFGMGRLFRQTHEICLIGTSNNKVYQKLSNKSQRSVSFAPNLKHSAKPEDLQDALEVMFPAAQKIELFARRSRDGWTCLGNEIDGKDIRDALAELK